VVTAPERRVSSTVGTRLESNQRFGTCATYRAGMSLRIGGGARATASVGTAFKAPSFYENFATGFERANPDHAPEHSLNWEAGLEYTGLRSTMTARVTYFHQRFRDLIQYSGAPLGPDSVNYSNVADAAAQGVELGVQGALGGGLSFDAGYTYLDSHDFATNLRLQRRPAHTAS